MQTLTLVFTFAALKQSKLGRVVHHGELVEQGLYDLTCPRLGAYVQVFGRVFGEVERCPVLKPPLLLSLFLW